MGEQTEATPTQGTEELREIQCIAIPVVLIKQLLEYLGKRPAEETSELYSNLKRNDVKVNVPINGGNQKASS